MNKITLVLMILILGVMATNSTTYSMDCVALTEPIQLVESSPSDLPPPPMEALAILVDHGVIEQSDVDYALDYYYGDGGNPDRDLSPLRAILEAIIRWGSAAANAMGPLQAAGEVVDWMNQLEPGEGYNVPGYTDPIHQYYP